MAHTDDVIKKIAKDFKANLNGNTEVRPLIKKMLKGTATYNDADKYALETAKALGKALSDNLQWGALSEVEYQTVISQVLPAGLESTYESVSNYAGAVQRGLNERYDIKLKVLKTKINAEDILNITKKAKKATAYTEVAGAVNQDTMSFAQNVAVNTMKDNADFQNNVGYTVTVERIYDDVGLHNRKEPCQWCIEKEGVWEYADALANGVFARHPGCGCTIIYHAEKGPQLQTDWTSNQWEDL